MTFCDMLAHVSMRLRQVAGQTLTAAGVRGGQMFVGYNVHTFLYQSTNQPDCLADTDLAR